MTWGAYKNGNTFTRINLANGTKIRETEDDEFLLEFPESLDIACTTFCTGGCPFCYASCSVQGQHADLLGAKFIDTLHPFTEAALQVNDLNHPQLVDFLYKLKDKKVIANITVNQKHFESKEPLMKKLVDEGLVKGIGISLVDPTPEFIKKVKNYPNAVIHTINGILKASDLEAMRDQGLKILILGYKDLGRGHDYKEKNKINIKGRQKYLYDVLFSLPEHFECVSFDNLALEQLEVKRILTPEQWKEFYLGDEGSSSMYIDLVKQKFGVSSLCTEEEMHPLMDSIDEMFRLVQADREI